MRRRVFLRAVAAGASVGCYACGPRRLEEKPSPLYTYAPCITEVDEASALLWIRTEGPCRVYARIRSLSTPEKLYLSDEFESRAGSDYTVALTLDLSELPKGSRYICEVVSAEGGTDRISKPVEFGKGPSPDGEVVFAWSADLRHAFAPYRILDVITDLQPQFMVLAGDLVYADMPNTDIALDLQAYRAKHRQNREDPHLQQMLQQVPVFAVWDDHDVANNFDRTHERLPIGYQSFLEYWPLHAPAAGGMYRSVRWGRDVELFILDCRMFRDPLPAKGTRHANERSRTMLGEVQKRWLYDSLRSSTAAFKFIVSSVPVLAPFGHDSWFSYPEERDELKEFLDREVKGRVIILSADYHLAWALEDRAHDLYEFIVGPLGSHPVPMYIKAAQRSGIGTFIVGGTPNFGTVRIFTSEGQQRAEVSVIDGTGTVRHRVIIPGS